MTVERDTDPCAGVAHFFHAGKCAMCGTALACCRNCRSSYSGAERGSVACGHGVDEEALFSGDGSNPIWAERKYSPTRLFAMLTGSRVTETKGMDDERLSPDDGRECATFEPKEGL